MTAPTTFDLQSRPRPVIARDHPLDTPSTPTTAIAGFGLITPLGINAASTWDALLAGGVILDHTNVPLAASEESRVTQLAQRAAREAIANAHWSADELREPATALVIGTSKGPALTWLQKAAAGRSTRIDDAFGLAEIAADIARHLKLGPGPRLTLSGACASGLHALIRAHMLIQSGDARRAIVVGVESSVHPLFIGSFQRLGILAKPGDGCRPFDTRRDGFYMSEAAAALCLESRQIHAQNDDADSTPRAIWIERFRLAADATHLTAADPAGGPLRTCLRAVFKAGPVDLIHAHGTATALNDPAELAAIESSLPPQDSPPTIYSHKGSLGHSLGASGMVAVVLNCLSHHKGIVPPNVQTRHPLPVRGAAIPPEPAERTIHRSTVTASGFGGAVAALSLISAPYIR